MNRTLIFTTLIAALLVITGCSGKVNVTGTAKFPDGTPLAKGNVFFRNADKTQMYQGTLQSDGSFALGEIEDGDGIPPGTYAAWIAGANTSDYQRNAAGDPAGRIIETVLIDKKYESPDTSGLSFTVGGGRNVIEITVDKP